MLKQDPPSSRTLECEMGLPNSGRLFASVGRIADGNHGLQETVRS